MSNRTTSNFELNAVYCALSFPKNCFENYKNLCSKLLKLYTALFFLGLILSAIKPKEYFTWLLEIIPAVLGIIVLTFTHKRFAFTHFTYGFILLHCCILFIGGHYTYAEVPFFDWIKEVLHQSRNNYDKVGHFMQGFVPAMIVRELFIRKNCSESKLFQFNHCGNLSCNKCCLRMA